MQSEQVCVCVLATWRNLIIPGMFRRHSCINEAKMQSYSLNGKWYVRNWSQTGTVSQPCPNRVPDLAGWAAQACPNVSQTYQNVSQRVPNPPKRVPTCPRILGPSVSQTCPKRVPTCPKYSPAHPIHYCINSCTPPPDSNYVWQASLHGRSIVSGEIWDDQIKLPVPDIRLMARKF